MLCRRRESDQPVVVDNEGDGFEQHSVLRIGVLDLLGLGWLLGFIEDGLQTLCQTTSQGCILCNNNGCVLIPFEFSQHQWIFILTLSQYRGNTGILLTPTHLLQKRN